MLVGIVLNMYMYTHVHVLYFVVECECEKCGEKRLKWVKEMWFRKESCYYTYNVCACTCMFLLFFFFNLCNTMQRIHELALG